MNHFKALVRWLLTRLYGVEVAGQQHLKALDQRVLVVANHTSLLDVVLLWAFLPVSLTFAVNTEVAKTWYVRLVKGFAGLFPLDPINPLSLRSLVRQLRKGGVVVIFPEGRITVTGALMKIYNGPGLVALKADAQILPIAIKGAQYTPFSRLKGKVRRRLFPKVSLTIFAPERIDLPADVKGRRQREYAGKVLSDIMTNMVFQASPYKHNLFERLLDARKIHGGQHQILEDIERTPLSYNDLILRALLLGELLSDGTKKGEHVGLLLPNMASAVVTFWAMQAYGRIPAMMNYTAGAAGLISAVEVAQLKTVVTARRFVTKAKLDGAVAQLAERVRIVYLEDIAANIGLKRKLRALLQSHSDRLIRRVIRLNAAPDDAAVVLFTSGTEGVPKGVVLSHANLLANLQQVSSRFDYTAQDVMLSTLPLFHSFGLTGCCLLPTLNGIKAFFYPTPLHYRVIPEIAYEINATVLFGTNTFLAGYGRAAHPYDFYSVRYVFAGAEKLQDEVVELWKQKFGLRLFEGYGATECSPVVSSNAPMSYRSGTVGKLMPGIEFYLEAVEGLSEGARLHVRGPNVMKGYLLHGQPGELLPPCSSQGEGWYDTGDIVTIDEDGFVTIKGRVKRFAKIAGEMVSLASVEALARDCWPDADHLAVTLSDAHKGEQIILLTTQAQAARSALLAVARSRCVGELYVPRRLLVIDQIPVLGSGKVDHRSAQGYVESVLTS